jgi:hypothetical protein
MQVICLEEDAFTSGWPTGWSVRHTKSSFEVVGVPHEVIDHFTKRTNEIGQIAQEKGITDAKALDTLGARTRISKEKGLGMEELCQDWKRQIRELEKSGGIADRLEYNAPLRDKGRHKGITKTGMTAEHCIDHVSSEILGGGDEFYSFFARKN